MRIEVQPPAGELAYAEAWELAPSVSLAVTGVRLDAFEGVGGALRHRLALAVAVHNGSDEPFELANEVGVIDPAGAFQRRVWVDPAKRPSALPGMCVLAPGERMTGEVFVSVAPAPGAAPRLYTPTLGGLAEHSCSGCGRDDHVFVPRALWQPVLIVDDAEVASA